MVLSFRCHKHPARSQLDNEIKKSENRIMHLYYALVNMIHLLSFQHH